MKNKLITLFIITIIYFLLKYQIPYGKYIIYPITLFVTFLHEFGHAFGALITGGEVVSVQINSDGSGLTTTSGGWRVIVVMGGYIGSAIFGNMLLYFGTKKDIIVSGKYNVSKIIIYFLAGLMLFTGVFWYDSFFSSIILLLISGGLIILAKYTKYYGIILQFLGITSLFFIIENFRTGPSGDLANFTKIFSIIPQTVWMYIWLIIVIVMTGYNIKYLSKGIKKDLNNS